MSDQCPYCESWNVRTIYFEDEWIYACDGCDREISQEEMLNACIEGVDNGGR